MFIKLLFMLCSQLETLSVEVAKQWRYNRVALPRTSVSGSACRGVACICGLATSRYRSRPVPSALGSALFLSRSFACTWTPLDAFAFFCPVTLPHLSFFSTLPYFFSLLIHHHHNCMPCSFLSFTDVVLSKRPSLICSCG